MMHRRRWLAALGLGALLTPGALGAQQTRNQRIAAAQQAYQNFDTGRALDLLRAALNPREGPQDSAWAYGVQLLGQIVSESGDTAQASVWFRWAFRLAPTTRIDTVNFLPEVEQAMRSARTSAVPSAGDPVSRTTWEWGVGAPSGQGRLQILAPRVTAPLNALVRRAGSTQPGQLVQSGQTVAVAVGSYSIEAAAEGYLPSQVTREVLPGVVTVVELNLLPVAAGILAANVRTVAFGRLVPLTVRRFPSDSTCAAGAIVGRGLVLTPYAAVRGAERVGAVVGTQRFGEDIRVLAWDVARNIAVLQVAATTTDSLPIAPQASPGQFAWALGFPTCQTPSEARTRIGAVQPALELADSLRDVERVGPLINGDGQLVGLVTGSRAAVPLASILTLIDAARRQVSAAQKLTVAQVALRENHAYGSVAITADVTGATGRITPLETWHWPGLEWSGSLPRTFSGPMGRYRLDVQFPGQASRQLTFTIRAGAAERFPITQQIAGGPGPQVPAAQRRGGKFPWPIALLGVGGAGAAVFLLAGKGGNGGGGGGGGTGTISVLIPQIP